MSQDFGKFYRFLATKDLGQGWDKYIDNNYGKKTDGVVIKAEFRAFMEAEWDWNGTGFNADSADGRDLINTFWAEIDNMVNGKIKTEIGTTLNDNMGLNAKEVEAVDNEIAIFKELNAFLAKLEAPSIIRTPENRKLWKEAVATDLTKALEAWDRSGDVTTYLTGISPKIEKSNAAIIYAKEYGESLKTSYLRDLKDYQIGNDEDLKALLNEYFATITGTEDYTDKDATTITDIKDAVEDIINTYLAEAGKGPKAPHTEGDDGTVTYTATAGDRLYRECTELQRAVIKNSVLQTLNSYITNNQGYEDLMKQIIGIFVDNLDADKTFDELMTSTTITADFEKSDEYKSFAAVKKVHDRYYNLAEDNNAFYARLVTEYGADVANVIKTDAAYMDTYKKSVDEVLAKIISGEIDYNNIDGQLANIDNMLLSKLNYQINNIVAEKLIPEALKEGDDPAVHTALKELYETMENTTEKIGNDDAEGKLAEYKESAIVYLDALYRLDGAYKTAIESVLGSDYATAINEMKKPSDVSSAIAEVETAIGLVVVASQIANVNWNSALTDVSLNIGETKTLMGNITGAVDGANAKVDITKMPINYSVSPATQNGTTIEIDKNGNITIKGGAENADINMEVTAEILGVRYSKTVTVKVQKDYSAEITKSNTYKRYVESSTVLKQADATGDTAQNASQAIEWAQTAIEDTIEDIAQSLKNEFPELSQNIDKTILTLKSYYKAYLNKLILEEYPYFTTQPFMQSFDTGGFKYQNYQTGLEETATGSYNIYYANVFKNAVGIYKTGQTELGISVIQNIESLNDDYFIYIEESAVYQKFIEFLTGTLEMPTTSDDGETTRRGGTTTGGTRRSS